MSALMKTRTGWRSWCHICGRSRYSKNPPRSTRCEKCKRFLQEIKR